MPDICIVVTDATTSGGYSYTDTRIDYQILIKGQAAVGGTTTSVGFDDTASAVNEALISAAITTLAGLSITVSATDSKRVIGGMHSR